jgi:hypothetical protein
MVILFKAASSRASNCCNLRKYAATTALFFGDFNTQLFGGTKKRRMAPKHMRIISLKGTKRRGLGACPHGEYYCRELQRE